MNCHLRARYIRHARRCDHSVAHLIGGQDERKRRSSSDSLVGASCSVKDCKLRRGSHDCARFFDKAAKGNRHSWRGLQELRVFRRLGGAYACKSACGSVDLLKYQSSADGINTVPFPVWPDADNLRLSSMTSTWSIKERHHKFFVPIICVTGQLHYRPCSSSKQNAESKCCSGRSSSSYDGCPVAGPTRRMTFIQ